MIVQGTCIKLDRSRCHDLVHIASPLHNHTPHGSLPPIGCSCLLPKHLLGSPSYETKKGTWTIYYLGLAKKVTSHLWRGKSLNVQHSRPWLQKHGERPNFSQPHP
jgi:hypothetical protein